MFSGAFWSFPRPRKCSAARFDAFRALGNVQRRVLTLSEASGRLQSSPGVPGKTWPAFLTPSEISRRLRSSPGTRPDLAGVPDAFHTSESDHGTALLEIKEGR